jgi:disulfide bond formation protein DsbB
MDATEGSEPRLAVMLDRLILWLILLAFAGVLSAAMAFQYFDREIPCPLCLLQRVAMFGCCFGLIQQLRDGETQRGAGIALIFAVLLLVISVRQTLLHIVPRPDTHTLAAPFLASICLCGLSSSPLRYCLDSPSD